MADASIHGPQGAIRQPDHSVLWRLWAPKARIARLVTWPGGHRVETAMAPGPPRYFTCRQAGVEEGLRYAYRLDDGPEYPDPASRWQPDGVHRPSAVFFPETYSWSDHAWRGVEPADLVLYELHVGTFTPAGTLDAAAERLEELARLGITAVELMPLAQFPGERNWGYDGVHPFAVQAGYGGPRALQRLIDAAHHAGLAVILDVVYNHFGPEGNYFDRFGPYFTDRYRTPWGKAVRFGDARAGGVRRFFLDNARMWVRDFHADGLRLDAVHAIYDRSPRHVLEEIRGAIAEEAARQNRRVHVIAESNQNDPRLVRPPAEGGYGLDAVWSDDFHHSVHALLTGERGGYYLDFGRAEHLAKALSDVFVYDGCHSEFRGRSHGSPVGDLDRSRFVVAVENHDQVGNRARGDRLATLVPPAACRLACGLLLVSPCTPLVFMGQEYGETRPFPFFCSFLDPGVAGQVRRGRRAEFAAFAWQAEIPDPQDPGTFASAKLAWAWPAGSFHAQIRQLYADLLAARRQWPALRDRRHTAVRLVRQETPCGAGVSPALSAGTAAPQGRAVLVVHRGIEPGLTVCANLTPDGQPLPPEAAEGMIVLSTEERRYGGRRDIETPPRGLDPYEMLMLGPREWRL
jgi:maltooligosyltrehalose trehalohydrolase